MLGIKLLLFLAPLLLFVIKVFFPWLARGIYTSNSNIKLSKTFIEEFFKLSIDYLFAAITYLLPKCIEYRLKIDELHEEISKIQDAGLIKQKDALVRIFESRLASAHGLAILFVAVLPFVVLLNDYANICGDVGKTRKKWIIISIVCLACLLACIFSISNY